MTLYRFQVFAAVAKHLNISKASKELHVSQPAVSQQLKALQDDCHIKLFQKRGRGIVLTPEGQTFRRDIEPILVHFGKLRGKYTSPDPRQKGDFLTLGGSLGPSTYLLPRLMSDFSRRYPDAQLQFFTGPSHEIEDRVVNGQVDIGVVAEPFPSPMLNMEPYRKEKVVAFVSSQHSLSRHSKIALSELANFHVVVSVGKDGKNRTAEFLSRLTNGRISLNSPIGCESSAALKNVVRRGAGIGITYQDVIREDVAEGKFKVLKLPLDLSVQDYIIYSRQKPLSSAASEFLTLLQASRPKSPWAKLTKSGIAFRETTMMGGLLIFKALKFLADFDCDSLARILT